MRARRGGPPAAVHQRAVDAGRRGGGVCVDGVPVLLDTTAALCFSAAVVPQGRRW
ncbi:hypothetical protein O1L55_21715 [Streptomyces albulus]|nr:hypothetical protein [Streptomyces noursei]